MRKAKIVATLGPSSNTVEKIEELIRAGLNVARINMSHGTHEAHAQVIKNVRQASLNTKIEVAVLLDLQGPKIRVDKLPSPLILESGQEWAIGPAKLQEKYPAFKDKFIPTVYEQLVSDCHVGCRVLFDDGLIVAKGIKKENDILIIKVEIGGQLKSNKGINLPDVKVSAPSFTKKDEEDLLFGLREGVDFVALSFVRTREDVAQVQYLLHKLRKNIPIVAKIERPEAIDNIDQILQVTDVIMVARGDMGVELGNHLVPSIQKRIINKCNNKGIPVITATQMLESMIQNSTPTRAEASDVANAIWDGTDAVMLSGETANGLYPKEAIAMMEKIIVEAERTPKERPLLRNIDLSAVNVATMVAASLIAEKVNAIKILSVTQSGNSCLKISRFRPTTPVLGITRDLHVARKMCLYWGVTPFVLEGFESATENLEKQVLELIRKRLNLQNGDKMVITRGDGKFFAKGLANSVRVEIIKDIPKVTAGADTLESVEFARGKINLDTHICASCQNCVSICPHEIWQTTTDKSNRTFINTAKVEFCTLDMACVEACPTGAIEIFTKDP